MTEQADYEKYTALLEQGKELRKDFDWLVYTNAGEKEVKEALAEAEAYCDSLIEVAVKSDYYEEKSDDPMRWYLVKTLCEAVEKNIKSTIIRLKVLLSEYVPEEIQWD